jgi:hypothetical protein
MKQIIRCSSLAALFINYAVAVSSANPPAAAQAIVNAYEAEEAEVMAKCREELRPSLQEAIAELQSLKDGFMKSGDLDGALAVRDLLTSLKVKVLLKGKDAKPDPGSFANTQAKAGDIVYYNVVGRASGPIWGTDIYTADTALATAAVHAGILKNAQEGVVKVVFKPGRGSYEASTRHGVTSAQWGNFAISYSVEIPSDD